MIDKLKDSFPDLIKSVSLRKGKGQYKDIIWYNIELSKPVFGYANINITPYVVIEEDLIQALNGSIRDICQPDIDKKTGNVHPAIKEVAKHSGVQVILVNGLGPIVPKGYEQENCDNLIKVTRQKFIPLANYYPLIKNIDDLSEVEKLKQDLLKQIYETFSSLNLMSRDGFVIKNKEERLCQ